jgi:CheY-like chemotaxis protein
MMSPDRPTGRETHLERPFSEVMWCVARGAARRKDAPQPVKCTGEDLKLLSRRLGSDRARRVRFAGLGHAAGFHIHLAKPIDPAELVTTIAALAKRFEPDGSPSSSETAQPILPT